MRDEVARRRQNQSERLRFGPGDLLPPEQVRGKEMRPQSGHDEPLPRLDPSVARSGRIHPRGDQPANRPGKHGVVVPVSGLPELFAQHVHRIPQRLADSVVEIPVHVPDQPRRRGEFPQATHDLQVGARALGHSHRQRMLELL